MRLKDLRLKRALRAALLVLLLSVAGMGKMYAQNNLIVNPDFESENTGFNSDYQYCPTGSVDAGQYCVDVTSAGHGIGSIGWPTILGYGGSGKYMLVNGFGGTTNPTKVVWKQTVTVTPNTDYIFLCQVVNLAQSIFGYSPNPAILRLKINGTTIGSDYQLAQNNNWHEWSVSWSNGNATQVEIAIYDVYTGDSGLGDDFGLDHLSFTPQATYSVNAVDDDVSLCVAYYQTYQIDVLANDIITPSDQISGATVQVIQNPTHGNATWNNSTRKINYTFLDQGYYGGLDQFKYRVTIPHGESSEAWVYINTGREPNVGWIDSPGTICAGGPLGISTPTVVPDQGTGQWEKCQTQNGTYMAFDPTNIPLSMNNWWVRYTVTNDCGQGSSNTVQISVTSYPTIGVILEPDPIYAGNSFNLTTPTIQNNGSTVTNQGWQIAATQNGTYNAFNNNNVPYTYNGYWIRYFAENDCGISYSNSVQITVYQNDNNIIFADANVKAICVANWDTNGDGELNYAEVAAVTDLGYYFLGNSQITSFDELQYFTGLTSIGYHAFSGCSGLTSLTIPNSVTSIVSGAFRLCSGLMSLTIPNSVTSIGYGAFYGCSGLTSLTIPNSVTSIGYYAFGYCSGLGQIIVDEDNPYYDSRENCNAIIETSTNTLITGSKNTIIPNSVTSIGYYAFYGCSGLTSVTIPNSVISIGYSAFGYCSGLTSLTIPNSVISIGDSAFEYCSGLTSLTIPNSVISIGYSAFGYCSGLGQIIVDEDNPYYDSRENCNAIIGTSTNTLITGSKNTIIPNSVTSIGDNAFSGCTGLTSLTIPNSVTSIGDYAFGYCSGLSTITVLAETPPTLGSDVFNNVDTSIPVNVPCSSISEYQSSVGWNEFTNYLPATTCASGEIIVTANPTEGGTVTGTGYYEGGTLCTLTAIPNEGFSFLNWMENGTIVSNDTVYSFIVSGDRDLVANFRIIKYNIWVDIQPRQGGTVNASESSRSLDMYYDFEDGMQGWIAIDGGSPQGYGWQLASGVLGTGNGYNGSVDCMISKSYDNDYGVIYPDNYLVSPQVQLGGSITFYACAQDANYAAEHFGVAVSMNSNTNPSDFQMIQEWTMTAKGVGAPTEITRSGNRSQGYWYQYTVDLSAFNGVGYVAIRHFNCSDMFYLDVDDITITNGGGNPIGSYLKGETCTLTAVPNEGWIFGNWTENGIVVSTDAEYSFIVTSHRSLVAQFDGSNIITFADPNVKAICVANWDTNEDGELSYAEAAAVTDLGQLFMENTEITSFEELQYFTGLTTIAEYAFDNCSNLSGALYIPNSVTTIGCFAFCNCSGLTGSLTIPNSVTTIGDNAFYGCSGLTGSLTIPSSVIEIATNLEMINPFSGCIGIEQIMVDINNPNYDSRENCNAIIETNTNKLVSGCKNSVIPDGVTTIGNGAFLGYNDFTGSLTIPNSVTTIGNWAFFGCSGLTGDWLIPNSVSTIGNYAFYNCSGFSELRMFGTIPPTLGYSAFDYSDFPIYVLYESLYDYKTATNWSYYEDRILPMAYTTISGYGESDGNYRFIASPLVENTDPTMVDNMITETEYDLYLFDQSAYGWEWQNYKANTESFVLENGQGYLYANAEEVNVIFKGEFNEDETKEVELAYDANADFAGWNLVGNPFPVSAYANKSYYTINEEGTAVEPNAVSSATAIPACTGVMVKADAQGESVVFNKMPTETASNQGGLQIALSQVVDRGGVSTGSTTAVDKAIVSFNAGDRLEKYVFNKDNARISIPQGGKDLAIACADKQGEMPLDFRATKNGTYTLSVDVENADVDYLHLIDNLTGADVDLLALRQAQGPMSYTFEAKTSDYASRFRLVFSVCGDADGDNAPFAFINNGNIIVTGAEAGAVLQIVDVTGRIIVCRDAARHVSTSGMTPGVYILRLINGNDVKTQKIVID